MCIATPILYVFAISHYCEKARWALEYLGVDFELRSIAPGLHMRLAHKHGLPTTSLPILIQNSEVIQGSAAIIDWAETHATSGKTLTPETMAQDSRAIEGRLDDIAGVHTRRYFYCEALIDYPAQVKSAFLQGIAWYQRILLHATWPRIQALMKQRMDLGVEQRAQSKAVVEDELAWLESLLADGRPYLAGNTFTRADITAASLFGRLAGSEDHPNAAGSFMPPKMKVDQSVWIDRPALAWIRGIYAQHRR